MADNWLYELLTWAVRESRVDVESWVRDARLKGGATGRDELASQIVNQQAKLAARAPVTPAAVGAMPGLRTAIRDGLFPIDVGLLFYRMIKSILYQAAAYEVRLDDPELPDRVLLVIGVALGDQRTRGALVGEGVQPPGKIRARVVKGGAEAYAAMLGQTLAERFRNHPTVSALPLVGRSFFGAQNFIYISAATLAGRYIFNDAVLSVEEINALDARVLELSRAVLAMMLWVARGDGAFDPTEQNTIMQLEESLMMPGMSYDALEENLPDVPDWNRIRQMFKTDDEKAGLLENILMVVWADGQKQEQEDRMCRRIAAELVADRMMDDIESAVRQFMTYSE